MPKLFSNTWKYLFFVFFLFPITLLAKTAEWIDEARLHDGRIIEVKRTVIYNFGSGELTYALQRWPNQFSLEAINPDTRKKIEWLGEKYVNPIMLDFVDGIPYLVIVSDRVFSNIQKYGCPEIPYVFLKYDEKTSKWTSVSNKAIPNMLHQANLSESHDGWMDEMHNGKRQSYQEILRRNKNREFGSGGFFSGIIPSNFEEWAYKKKNRLKNTRFTNDCRPPLSLPVDAVNPISPTQPSKSVKLEVIEQKDYEPKLQINNSDWSALSWDNVRYQSCNSLLQPADPDNPQLDAWQLFVNDPTGTKVTSNRNSNRICENDTIWFVDYVAEKSKVVVIKANKIGDVVYRISFDKPVEDMGFSGAIRMPTFKSEGGYISFEWLIFRNIGQSWEVKRIIKVRFLEPVKQ